jgi:hypothetical protein
MIPPTVAGISDVSVLVLSRTCSYIFSRIAQELQAFIFEYDPIKSSQQLLFKLLGESTI